MSTSSRTPFATATITRRENSTHTHADADAHTGGRTSGRARAEPYKVLFGTFVARYAFRDYLGPDDRRGVHLTSFADAEHASFLCLWIATFGHQSDNNA